MPQFIRFHVLYRENLAPEKKEYWQITIRPTDDGSMFEVRMFGGPVIRPEPNFKADNDHAEYSTHSTIAEALQKAEAERDRLIAAGRTLHSEPAL